MKQIFIDLTSKNCIFNPVEPQGSFLFHRFGKRDIPEEHLDIDLLLSYLDKENPNQIILESVFGDTLEYKYLLELLEYCKKKNIDIVCICNGYSDNFKLTKDYNIYFIFKIYGFTKSFNTLFPDYDFNKLLNNLSFCNKIQYNLYEQNLCDIEDVFNTGKEIEFVEGPLVHFNINHVITSDGTWLYDINGLDNLEIADLTYDNLLKHKDTDIILNKSMNGYHLLKNFVMPVQGISILDTDLYHIENVPSFDKSISVSYKGHIFNSMEKKNIVTNGYIPDWKVELFFNKDQYYKNILAILSEFANNDKVTI